MSKVKLSNSNRQVMSPVGVHFGVAEDNDIIEYSIKPMKSMIWTPQTLSVSLELIDHIKHHQQNIDDGMTYSCHKRLFNFSIKL